MSVDQLGKHELPCGDTRALDFAAMALLLSNIQPVRVAGAVLVRG